jgi:DNA ligase-4
MSVASLLKELLDPLSAPRIALVIQIILRDLSPLLYAHPSSTGSASLLRYNTNAYNRIELWQAMRAWHDQMPRLYRVTADLDVVARELEKACCEHRTSKSLAPH